MNSSLLNTLRDLAAGYLDTYAPELGDALDEEGASAASRAHDALVELLLEARRLRDPGSEGLFVMPPPPLEWTPEAIEELRRAVGRGGQLVPAAGVEFVTAHAAPGSLGAALSASLTRPRPREVVIVGTEGAGEIRQASTTPTEYALRLDDDDPILKLIKPFEPVVLPFHMWPLDEHDDCGVPLDLDEVIRHDGVEARAESTAGDNLDEAREWAVEIARQEASTGYVDAAVLFNENMAVADAQRAGAWGVGAGGDCGGEGCAEPAGAPRGFVETDTDGWSCGHGVGEWCGQDCPECSGSDLVKPIPADTNDSGGA